MTRQEIVGQMRHVGGSVEKGPKHGTWVSLFLWSALGHADATTWRLVIYVIVYWATQWR
jgi:hypothetical protein